MNRKQKDARLKRLKVEREQRLQARVEAARLMARIEAERIAALDRPQHVAEAW